MFDVRKLVPRRQPSANRLLTSAVVSTQYTSVTDRRTDRHRTTALSRFTTRGKNYRGVHASRESRYWPRIG